LRRPDGCFGSDPGYAFDNQSHGKIGQQTCVAGKAKVGIGKPCPNQPVGTWGVRYKA
jgi:hypothetical protein